MTEPATRSAALVAAAALVGPRIPASIVSERPHEAAKALTRLADLLIPWLEGEPLAEAHDSIARQAAATAAQAHPATGETDGSTRTDPEEKQPAAQDQQT